MTDPAPIEPWIQQIVPEPLVRAAREAYGSPGRHYHTWAHVLACFRALRDFQGSASATLEHPDEVAIALLLHDAVYVPGRKDNEERSADLAARLLPETTSMGPAGIDRVREMIRLTRDHRADRPLGRDEEVVLDVDLSVLGRPWREYRRYMLGVRREYCPAVASKALYRASRRAFLRQLLREAELFRTEHFRSRLERPARENIAREIELLRPRSAGGRLLELLVTIGQRLRGMT